MGREFGCLLFSTSPAFIRLAVAAGVDGIIVDFESRGKQQRQLVADTEINHNTIEDLCQVRACTRARVICRINGYGETIAEEIEGVIEAGADEILLPMVRSPEEVEAVLDRVEGRCGVGILVETVAAVESVEELARLPLSRVYVGLNDLAIERKKRNIFSAVVDGTVERIRGPFRVPFGFAGLTLPDCGSPIPCRLLIGELARLDCDFSFLRRAFHRDIRGRDLAIEVPRIREAIRQARLRTPAEIDRDWHELREAIEAWPGGLVAAEEASRCS
jgi:hypothetical protein